MKKIIILLTFLLAVTNTVQADSSEIKNVLSNYSYQNLSDEEIEGLLYTIEEEKLARDVYLNLYEKWNMKIFTNIASSEQNHMEVLQYLIEKYKLENPINEIEGEFTNQELADLYNQLVKKGNMSLTDALEVGAIIEDMDIADLQDLIEQTDNLDLSIAYQNLQKGSRNHMRSFSMQLEKQEVEYNPQYINESQYQQIINSEKEKGILYNSNGNILKECEEEKENKQQGKGFEGKHESNTNHFKESNLQSQNIIQKIWRGFLRWFN